MVWSLHDAGGMLVMSVEAKLSMHNATAHSITRTEDFPFALFIRRG